MSTEDKDTQQKMSIYFPLDLLRRVRESAKRNKRSFNKEAQWLIERGLASPQKDRQP